MEKVRLILDSSSNTLSDPARNLVVVPLTLTFGEENMLDDEKLDISEFLAKMEANNEAEHPRRADCRPDDRYVP